MKAREAPEVEKIIDGHSGFLFLDDNGMPEVAMHWEHRFNHMVHRYNDIFREQMPNITPHFFGQSYTILINWDGPESALSRLTFLDF